MAYITTDRKADATSDLAYYIALIAWLDTAIGDASRNPGTKQYIFDGGTGRQSETFHSPQMMITARREAESKRDFNRRLLGGQTVIRQQTRR